MRVRNTVVPILRATLRQHKDGLTLKQLAEQSGVTYRSVHTSIQTMPDVYIDRWDSPTGRFRYQAVWCAVEVPENCPHPGKKK